MAEKTRKKISSTLEDFILGGYVIAFQVLRTGAFYTFSPRKFIAQSRATILGEEEAKSPYSYPLTYFVITLTLMTLLLGYYSRNLEGLPGISALLGLGGFGIGFLSFSFSAYPEFESFDEMHDAIVSGDIVIILISSLPYVLGVGFVAWALCFCGRRFKIQFSFSQSLRVAAYLAGTIFYWICFYTVTFAFLDSILLPFIDPTSSYGAIRTLIATVSFEK